MIRAIRILLAAMMAVGTGILTVMGMMLAFDEWGAWGMVMGVCIAVPFFCLVCATLGRVAYRDDECAVLLALKPSPEVLRRIHEAKSAFPRSVLQQPEDGKRTVNLFKGGAQVAMVEG